MSKKELLKYTEKLKIEFNHIQIKRLELLTTNDNYFYLLKDGIQITQFYNAKDMYLFISGYNVLNSKKN